MAFEMAERGDREAKDAILQIFQWDRREEKRARAKNCWNSLPRPGQQRRLAGHRSREDSYASRSGRNALASFLPAFVWISQLREDRT